MSAARSSALPIVGASLEAVPDSRSSRRATLKAVVDSRSSRRATVAGVSAGLSSEGLATAEDEDGGGGASLLAALSAVAGTALEGAGVRAGREKERLRRTIAAGSAGSAILGGAGVEGDAEGC